MVEQALGRPRWRGALGIASAIGIGLASRLHPLGWWVTDKSLGDVLYAVMVFSGWTVLFPRRRTIELGVAALLLCYAIETFQLTGIPLAYAHLRGVRWVLGTTFAWHDIACYTVGIAFACALDHVSYGRSRS